MRQNLDTLKSEIQEYLEAEKFIIFYGYSRWMDSMPLVYWDTTRHTDFKMFLSVATRVEAKIIVFHQRTLTPGQVADAIDRLESSDLTREEQRKMERRLRELAAYEGFTCALELSFDHLGRIYAFDLRADWYEEMTEIVAEIDASQPEDDLEDEEGPIGGYFSKN